MNSGPEADRDIQAVCLRWIAEFLTFDKDVILPFTPRLIPVVMSALAHHVPSLRQAANNLNQSLFQVISDLPVVDANTHQDQEDNKESVSASTSSIPFPSLPVPTSRIP